MLVYLGNVKGPKGDKGDKGEPGIQGPIGPVGPKGETGPLPPLVNNLNGAEEGTAALDAHIGPNIVDKSMISNEQIDSEDKIPSSDLVYAMQGDINKINNSLRFSGDTNYVRFASSYANDGLHLREGIDDNNFLNLRTNIEHELILEKAINGETQILTEYIQKKDIDNKVRQTQYSTFLLAPTENTKRYLGINTSGTIFKQIDETAYSIPYYRYNHRSTEIEPLHYTFLSNERHFFGFFTTEGSNGMNGHHGIISIDLNYSRDNGSITKLTDTSFTFELLNVTSEGFDIEVIGSTGNKVQYLTLNVLPL